jgi:transcriptional regulator with XRE-family HTH domain
MMVRARSSAAFGTIVRRHRSAQGLSQERLAEAAEIHRNYVGMLERGECAATLDVADRLAEALGTPLEDLSGEARRALARDTVVLPRRRLGQRRGR